MKINLQRLFEDAVKRKGSRKDQENAFRELVFSNPAAIEALVEDYFDRHQARWKPDETGALVATSTTRQRIQTAEQRREQKEKTAQAAKALAAKVREVVLMECIMPNGKKAGKCTGAELVRFGGFWAAVGHTLKPTEVLDLHKTDEELREFYRRHEITWRRQDIKVAS